MNKQEIKVDRRSRYSELLLPLIDAPPFTVSEAQSHCKWEKPRFVSSVLRQLVRDRLLDLEEAADGERYCWKGPGDVQRLQAWIDERVSGRQLKTKPSQDRPRERLLHLGAANLRTAELLAILIRTGRPGESALDAGERIVSRLHENFSSLREQSPSELKGISKAISEPAYCQIMAGIELGRRVHDALQEKNRKPIKIDNSRTACDYCQLHFERLALDRQQEEFHIVTLNTKLQPIGHHLITVGTLDASLVAPREVFRPAIRDAASAVLLVHNHPSGDPTPSRQDIMVTDQLEAVAKIVGIQVIDHVIVSSRGALSIHDHRATGGGAR